MNRDSFPRIVLLLLLAFATARADTNTISLTLSSNRLPSVATSLKLSKDMLRLNASPYFRSTLDEWTGVIRNQLYANVLPGPGHSLVTLGATRLAFEKLPPRYFLNLFIHSDRAKDAALLSATQSLYMVVDGTRVTLHPDPAILDDDVIDVRDGYISEHLRYQVDAHFLRSLARASKAQLRIEGLQWAFVRDLSSTNLNRFRVFVDTFMKDDLPAPALNERVPPR